MDSLLCQRSSDENEATRRIKTEFLVQLDGTGTNQQARVVVIGATNRPDELDEAVRRRFVKRIYIPLPDQSSRQQLLYSLLYKVKHCLTTADFDSLVAKTNGFSGVYSVYSTSQLFTYFKTHSSIDSNTLHHKQRNYC